MQYHETQAYREWFAGLKAGDTVQVEVLDKFGTLYPQGTWNVVLHDHTPNQPFRVMFGQNLHMCFLPNGEARISGNPKGKLIARIYPVGDSMRWNYQCLDIMTGHKQ